MGILGTPSLRYRDYTEVRQIYVPYNRIKYLKDHWTELKKPIVENMRLAIKIDFKARNVNKLFSLNIIKCRRVNKIKIFTIKIKKKAHIEDVKALQRAFD